MSAASVHPIQASDGVNLALHRLGPPDATPVLLVPGTFSNHTFWLGTRGTGFARRLAENGYAAWVLDPRGHGLSQRPEPGQRWVFDDWARKDLPAALRTATDDHRAPAFLIGHSAGGAAILAALAAHPELRPLVRGIVIAGTPVPWLQPFRGLGARAILGLTRIHGRFPARALRLGPEDEIPGVMIQWMEWNLRGRWVGNDGTDYQQRFADLDVPTFFLAGAGDKLFAPPYACRALFDMIGSDEKAFLLCGRRTGFSHDYGHAGLLVHRSARIEVWPRILAWIQARILR